MKKYALVLALMSAGCAPKVIAVPAGVEVGGDPSLERTAAIPEDDSGETAPRRVCVQWFIEQKEGPMTWEWRCITADRLRDLLFPESAIGRK